MKSEEGGGDEPSSHLPSSGECLAPDFRRDANGFPVVAGNEVGCGSSPIPGSCKTPYVINADEIVIKKNTHRIYANSICQKSDNPQVIVLSIKRRICED